MAQAMAGSWTGYCSALRRPSHAPGHGRALARPLLFATPPGRAMRYPPGIWPSPWTGRGPSQGPIAQAMDGQWSRPWPRPGAHPPGVLSSGNVPYLQDRTLLEGILLEGALLECTLLASAQAMVSSPWPGHGLATTTQRYSRPRTCLGQATARRDAAQRAMRYTPGLYPPGADPPGFTLGRCPLGGYSRVRITRAVLVTRALVLPIGFEWLRLARLHKFVKTRRACFREFAKTRRACFREFANTRRACSRKFAKTRRACFRKFEREHPRRHLARRHGTWRGHGRWHLARRR